MNIRISLRWLVAILLLSHGVTLPAFAQPVGTSDELDRAAREFRITVYNTFRRDRAEFDRRHAVWREIEKRWRAEAASSDQHAVLAVWLAQAADANRTKRPLPPSPPLASLVIKRGGTEKAIPQQRAITAPVAPPLEAAVAPLAKRTTEIAPPASSLGEVPIANTPLVSGDSGGGSRVPPRATDNIQAEHTPPRTATRSPAAEVDVASDPIESPEVPRSVDDGINVAQVAVRVAGYNLAAATLLDDMERNTRPTKDEMAEFAQRVNALMLRADDLAPYFSLVAAGERTQLGELAPLDTVIERLQERNLEIAKRARGDD